MAKLSEGEWNGFGFRFRPATTEDSDEIEILLHSNYFPEDFETFGTENLQDYEKDFKKIWMEALKQDLSFVAIHIQTNKLAGVRINYEQTRELDISTKIDLKCPQLKLILTPKNGDCDDGGKKGKIFERYGSTDKYAVQIVSCIDKRYGGSRLTIEMYERSMELLRTRNLYYCKLSPILTNCLKVKAQCCQPEEMIPE